MMKRAVLYMRVSTVDQHAETQLHDLRIMAAQRGYEIVREYTDKISGTRAKRPGLDEVLSEARRGRFDVVVVWAFDRLARSVKHFLEVLDELNHLHIEFISFRENVDTSGPLGRAMLKSALRRFVSSSPVFGTYRTQIGPKFLNDPSKARRSLPITNIQFDNLVVRA
jgi:DNA invertase Pin-like site-specific DNA recombinase